VDCSLGALVTVSLGLAALPVTAVPPGFVLEPVGLTFGPQLRSRDPGLGRCEIRDRLRAR
jgi:hypothetical protein